MKKLFSFVVILLIVVVGCGKDENKKTNTAIKKESKKIDSLIVTPTKIGVSELEESFTAFPECDGGECFSIRYIIAVNLDNLFEKQNIHTVPVEESVYKVLKGTAKNDDAILKAKKIYYELRDINRLNVSVFLINGKLEKITKKEDFSGTMFIPEKILWEKKK